MPERRIFLALYGLASVFPFQAHAAATEVQLRAAFVASFGSYAQWPASVLPEDNGHFIIGVMGDREVYEVLTAAVVGRRIQGRPVEVRAIETAAQATAVHLLYASDTRVLRVVSGLPILTVGVSADFAERGGTIRLLTVDNRMRFEVNLRAVERGGLKLSAKLQQLAVNAYSESR